MGRRRRRQARGPAAPAARRLRGDAPGLADSRQRCGRRPAGARSIDLRRRPASAPIEWFSRPGEPARYKTDLYRTSDTAPRDAMHAVILAGGKGVRLRPYTTTLPKPLVPIGDEYSILEIVLRQLARAGLHSVTLAIGHLGQLIRAYVGDGSQWGMRRRLRHRGRAAGHHRPGAAACSTGCPSSSWS